MKSTPSGRAAPLAVERLHRGSPTRVRAHRERATGRHVPPPVLRQPEAGSTRKLEQASEADKPWPWHAVAHFVRRYRRLEGPGPLALAAGGLGARAQAWRALSTPQSRAGRAIVSGCASSRRPLPGATWPPDQLAHQLGIATAALAGRIALCVGERVAAQPRKTRDPSGHSHLCAGHPACQARDRHPLAGAEPRLGPARPRAADAVGFVPS
jgi:hypothetical protein